MGNPDRQTLQTVSYLIQRLSDENWHVLESTCRLMGEQAWVGPSARELERTVRDDQAKLHEQLAIAVTSVRAKLDSLSAGR